MIKPTKPKNEADRMAALERYKILDTLTEQNYNDITRLASQVCGTEMAVISLIDHERQWFKSAVGIDGTETERDLAFCAHAILQDHIMVVPDALKDQRFQDNPLVTKDPNIRFYAGAPLLTSDGHALGTLCVIDRKPQTLSEDKLKVLEALSRQVMALLELRLNMMKLHDMSIELAKARDAALNLVESKSFFLANVSHEIRTPMAGIMGMADFLKATPLNSEQSEYVHHIQQSSKTLLTLINDILDSAKMEAGKMVVEHINFDLNKMLSDVEMMFRLEAQRKNIQLRFNLTSMTNSVKGDALRIRQVLVNFLGNAFKFTQKGSIEVKTSVVSDVNNKLKMRFEVQDTGSGISADKLKNLFQDYVQADETVARHFGGTGLGLSISKRLVRLMQGEIGATSVDQQGSTFWFEVEFEKGPEFLDKIAGNTQAAAVSRHEQVFSLAQASHYHVLVAEDNLVNQKIIQRTLETLGFNTHIVVDGSEVLPALQKKHFDLVLMDCHMPKMSGFAATEAVRNSEFKQIPIIALTAGAMPEDEAKARQSGMSDFMTKPFTQETLVKKLAHWLLEKK